MNQDPTFKKRRRNAVGTLAAIGATAALALGSHSGSNHNNSSKHPKEIQTGEYMPISIPDLKKNTVTVKANENSTPLSLVDDVDPALAGDDYNYSRAGNLVNQQATLNKVLEVVNEESVKRGEIGGVIAGQSYDIPVVRPVSVTEIIGPRPDQITVEPDFIVPPTTTYTRGPGPTGSQPGA